MHFCAIDFGLARAGIGYWVMHLKVIVFLISLRYNYLLVLRTKLVLYIRLLISGRVARYSVGRFSLFSFIAYDSYNKYIQEAQLWQR